MGESKGYIGEIGGVIGATAGAITGGPPGAAMGWNVGSSIGNQFEGSDTKKSGTAKKVDKGSKGISQLMSIMGGGQGGGTGGAQLLSSGPQGLTFDDYFGAKQPGDIDIAGGFLQGGDAAGPGGASGGGAFGLDPSQLGVIGEALGGLGGNKQAPPEQPDSSLFVAMLQKLMAQKPQQTQFTPYNYDVAPTQLVQNKFIR